MRTLVTPALVAVVGLGLLSPQGVARVALAGGGVAATTSASPPRPTAKTYTVEPGDTLTAIAARSGVSLAALEAANPQVHDPDRIDVGEVLHLPGGAQSPTAPSSPHAGAPAPSAGPRVEGVDVSEFQGVIDWGQVASSGIGFAFVRANDGLYHDVEFERNWAEARAHGIVRGAYQYFRASQDGAVQAEDFLTRFSLQPGDLPPVADVEELDGESAGVLATGLKKWIEVVAARTGKTPIVYTSPGLWDGWGMPDLHAEGLWVANWFVNAPALPSGWNDWTFWQYTNAGSVAGIPSAVDRDVFHGTLTDLQHFATRHGATGTGGTTSAPPPPPPARTYTVRSGDTLSAIAAASGVTLAELEAANPGITDPDVISPGEEVRIP